jgi:hypothetical protein
MRARDWDSVVVAVSGAALLAMLAFALATRICGCGRAAIQPTEDTEYTEEGDAAMNRFYAGVVGER